MHPDRNLSGGSPAEGFRTGLRATLRELRIAATRQHLRRLHPDAREDELDELMRNWLGEGPEALDAAPVPNELT